MNQVIIRRAQDFAARWGFLSRELFFEFLCPMSQAQQYRYWKHLIVTGSFVPSKANSEVLILSQKSRAQLKDGAREARLPAYIEHDSHVARFHLMLQRHGILGRSWTEDELVRNRLLSYEVLGAEQLNRVPDLIVDLKTTSGPMRCALEIEKTTKSKTRYLRIANAYLDYRKVDLMIFGCGSATIEGAVKGAFRGRAFVVGQKIPARYQYEELRSKGMLAPFRVGESEFELRDFLSVITGKEVADTTPEGDRNERSFSLRNCKELEAA